MTCTSEICWSDKICCHSILSKQLWYAMTCTPEICWSDQICSTISCLNSCYMAMTCTQEICWSDKICCHSILSEQLLYGYDMYTRNMLIWQNLLPLYLVWTVVFWLWHVHQKYADLTKFAATLSCLNSCYLAMACTSEICWSDKICCHSILSEHLLYGYDMYIRNMLIWQNLLPLYLVWTFVIWLWHVHQKYANLTKFAATLSCLNSCYMAMTCTSEICWSDKICCHSILSEQLLYGYDMYIRNMLIWQNLLPLYLVWTVVIWLWHVHQKYADLTKFAATLSCLNSCYMAMTCTSEIYWSDKICCHSILSEQLLYGYDMYTRNMLIWQNLLPLYLV